MTIQFSTERLNSTAVQAMWSEVVSEYVDHYTVYYYPNPAQNDRRKRQNNEQMVVFPAGSSSGVIGGLNEEQDYLFSLAITFIISGELFEGERTDSVSIGWMPRGLSSVTCQNTSILLFLTGEIVTQLPTVEPSTTDSSTTADMPTDVTASQGGTEPPSGSDNTVTILGSIVGGIIASVVLVIMVLVVIVIVVIVCIRL